MPNPDVTCVLVKIHGVGNQKRAWSARFDAMLDAKLQTLSATQRSHFASESVWWADVSRLPGMAAPAGVAAAPGVTPTLDQADVQIANDYMSHLLGGGAGAGATTAGLSIPNPTTVIARLKDVVVSAADSANDVANYVSNNGVRIQMQHRLTEKLVEVGAEYPNATVVLGSHSQGTIVAYDLLRLSGSELAKLTTWVTMGSPLAYYLHFLRWGKEALSIQPTLTWLNYFDDQDKVGQALAGLTGWAAPAPQDADVDNTGNGVDPHDHWHNPAVVDRYFQIVRQHL
jgi:hypothetical protein